LPESHAVPEVPKIAGWINGQTKGRPTPAAFLRFHRWLYQTTDGRLGHGLVGAPSLVMFTTGRHSGKQRISVLIYGRDGDRFVVAASNDGLDHHPGWFFNVQVDPAVKLQVARNKLAGRAQVVETSSPEYSRLWALMNATNHGRYDGYQSKTERSIPLVVVTPSSVEHGT